MTERQFFVFGVYVSVDDELNTILPDGGFLAASSVAAAGENYGTASGVGAAQAVAAVATTNVYAVGRASGFAVVSGQSTAKDKGKPKTAKGRADGFGAARATALRGSAGFATASGSGGALGSGLALVQSDATGFAAGIADAAAASEPGSAGYASGYGEAAGTFGFEAESDGLAFGGGAAVAFTPTDGVGIAVGAGDSFAASAATFGSAGDSAGIGQAIGAAADAAFGIADGSGLAAAVAATESMAVGAAVGVGAADANAGSQGQAASSGAADAVGTTAEEIVEPPVAPPVYGGDWWPWRQQPVAVAVEGVGYAILPGIEGEAHGVVLAVGAGAAFLPASNVGTAVGAIGVVARGTARLSLKAAAVGEPGLAGAARAVLRGLSGTSAGVTIARGSGSGAIIGFQAAAIGRHDDDEAAILALLAA